MNEALGRGCLLDQRAGNMDFVRLGFRRGDWSVTAKSDGVDIITLRKNQHDEPNS